MAIRFVAGILGALVCLSGCSETWHPYALGWSNTSRACAEKVNDDGGIDSTDALSNISTCYKGTGAIVGMQVKL